MNGGRRLSVLLTALTMLLVACGGAQPAGQEAAPGSTADTGGESTAAGTTTADTPAATTPASPAEAVSGTVRLYTSVTQDTVDAVVAAFQEANPDVDLEVFRAPTGELTARVAAEQREGGIQADVFWLTDPLSMQQYAAQDLLLDWTPDNAEAIPAEYQQDTFWGTRLLNIVIVHQEGLEPAPTAWTDLAEAGYEQPVAIPDPGFAGSAFGALGYFALDENFGFAYYEALADGGVVQVQSPGEVVTGVAEGQYAAGMTLDRTARDAIADGSPIAMVVPDPGAVAIYSPVAVVRSTSNAEAAQSFADYTLTVEAQQAIADTGWQPVRPDVTFEPAVADTVSPDWEVIFDRQDELLEEYRAIIN